MEENLVRFDKKIKILFIDFETSNLCLSSRFNLPWQMALLKVTGGEADGGGESVLVNWGEEFKFSKGALEMAHSFCKDKMQKEGLKPIDAFNKLSDALSDADAIAGHNILGFDIYMIKGMYEKMGRKLPNILGKKKIFDTLALAKGYFNNIPIQKNENPVSYQYKMINNIIRGSKTSLSKVAESFNIEYDQGMLHDALYDLNLNLKVWNKLKYQIDF
jgi:hypothetical protein